MTQQHPITPPPELVAAWCRETDDNEPMFPQVAAKAAQWGADQAKADIRRERQEAADQELEACVAWLDGFDREGWAAEQLRAARRPKPKSEKQQALEDLDALQADLANYGMGFKTTNIRRALESIPDPS